MFNSLTHRIIASESLARLKTNDAIHWANICIELGIETESILILSTLNDQVNQWEIRDYLDQRLRQVGLKFLSKENSLNCLIQSYALQIIEDLTFEVPLAELYSISMEFELQKELRGFWLLYWANESWRANHENKYCYVDGFRPDKLANMLTVEAENWLNASGREYFRIDDIRAIPQL